MPEAKGLVKSPFTIYSAVTGATWMTADLATVNAWNTILSYATPLGMAIEITPVNYHFGLLRTTGDTAITAGMTRIMKQNANGTESREIWSGANGIFKDIGDEFQRPKIRVSVIVNASQVLVVQVYGMGTTLDSVYSNFFIECVQYYEEI